jgi:hypothetical protein
MKEWIVNFAGYECIPVLDYYDADQQRVCIRLFTREGEPVAVATVNMPKYPDLKLGPDVAFIKDYSENEGLLQALIDAGIVLIDDDGPLDVVPSGFVQIPLVQLNREWTDRFDVYQGESEEEIVGHFPGCIDGNNSDEINDRPV